jgi:hypothetical protein
LRCVLILAIEMIMETEATKLKRRLSCLVQSVVERDKRDIVRSLLSSCVGCLWLVSMVFVYTEIVELGCSFRRWADSLMKSGQGNIMSCSLDGVG